MILPIKPEMILNLSSREHEENIFKTSQITLTIGTNL